MRISNAVAFYPLLFALFFSKSNAVIFDYSFPEENFDFAAENFDIEDPSKLYLLPVSKPIGQVSGLGVNSKGDLVAFHRADRIWDLSSFGRSNKFNSSLGPINANTIYVINKTGGVIGEYGKNIFYMPHGLSVDQEGNSWVTDVGRHQVMKFDKDYNLLLELGEKLVPGSDNDHFCMPTDVAIASNGDFFVADGYCNARIMKFNKSGKFVASFESNFRVPHSIALIEDLNMLCVADRENNRIECFAAGLIGGPITPAGRIGKPITKAENIGPVYAIREKNHYLVGVTGSNGEDIEPQVFVVDMDNGHVNTFAKGIENAHSLAVSDDGTILIGQINPNQIIQLSLADQ